MIEQIQNDFQEIINKYTFEDNPFKHLIEYATLPAGKLFRPQLVYALAHDLGAINSDHKLLAAAIEVHHAYSLVHDDLPAMDNDDWRRGKESHHKKFGQWKAILTGDALIALSFEILTHMQSEHTLHITNLFASMVGQRGLILGQYLDLSHENQTFDKLCHLHNLKTGNLISFSLLGSLILTKREGLKAQINQLGQSIGLIFQLIDDLSELNEELDQHEEDINAFLNFDESTVTKRVLIEDETIKHILKDQNLKHLSEIYHNYKIKMLSGLKVANYQKHSIYIEQIKTNLLN